MIRKLLAIDGVIAICSFRDDGAFVEGHGTLDESQMIGLTSFAHDYKRIIQGNADQLSMFTQMSGWTPPDAWIVRGPEMSVCSYGNVVCVIDNNEASINELMNELKEAAHL
jgi:roadblock/LC7 domain-containing protein